MEEDAQTPPDLHALVRSFRNNLRDLKSDAGGVEATVRQEYIDPFWRLLGWDIGNTQGQSIADKDVLIEKSMGSTNGPGSAKRPDYIFRVDSFPRFIVEAKKPGLDLKSDRDSIFQAKSYAWSAQIPFAILTDFEEFRLFDTTLKPFYNRPEKGVVAEFDLQFSDYQAQWDLLYRTLSRQSVGNGSLETLVRKIKHLRSATRIRGIDRQLFDFKGHDPVDKLFLVHLEQYRLRFAKIFFSVNRTAFPNVHQAAGAAKLTEATQRLLDRLVFVRVCEDRGVLEYGGLRELINRSADTGSNVYKDLCAYFGQLDEAYNGYLFKPHFTEELDFDNEVLVEFIRSLYHPESPYRFDALADDLLGTIYERYLGSVITFRDGQIVAELKPEVRHAGGVYYTPRFVVNAIVRGTLAKRIHKLQPADVLDVKIVDPACGSGSFLIAAYQFLIEHCESYISQNPASAEAPLTPRARSRTRSIAFQDQAGAWHLTPDFRAELLTSCIHGVDIDPQAVEVTIMSLYLKLLEAKLPNNWQKDMLSARLMPILDNNIRCGNSLIDPNDYRVFWESENRDLFDVNESTLFRLNLFSWSSDTHGFGRVFEQSGGFDIVIGNPPYIRIQELQKWAADECAFYKHHYQSARQGNIDIYVVFFEKGVRIMNANGYLGFIAPHKYWQASYGFGLRKFIADTIRVDEIIDFGAEQVFRDASTYTAIQILSSEEVSSPVRYAKVLELDDGERQCHAIQLGKQVDGIYSFPADPIPSGGDPWYFMPPETKKLVASMDIGQSPKLKEIMVRMYQGIRTSANTVYVLDSLGDGKYRSKSLGTTIDLEDDFLRPFLDGGEIQRYEIRPANKVVLCPYQTDRSGRVELIDQKTLMSQCPMTWRYLQANQQLLRDRERGKMDHAGWYGYVYPKNLDMDGIPRLIVRDIVFSGSFAFDSEGEFTFVSGYGLILHKQYRHLYHYILGLLNSSPVTEYLRSISTPIRGGWFRTFPQFLEQIPVPISANGGQAAGALINRIANSAKHLLQLYGTSSRGISDRESAEIGRAIEAEEETIDKAVIKLYAQNAKG